MVNSRGPLRNMLCAVLVGLPVVPALAQSLPIVGQSPSLCSDDDGLCGLCKKPGTTCYNAGPHSNEWGKCKTVDCTYPLGLSPDPNRGGQDAPIPCDKCIAEEGCRMGGGDTTAWVVLAGLMARRKRENRKQETGNRE